MKKKLIYLPLLATLLVVSCSKKDDDNQPTTTSTTATTATTATSASTATTATTATTASTATTATTASTATTSTTATTATTATTGTTATNSSIQITVDSDPVFRGTVDGVFYYLNTGSFSYINNTGSDKNIPPPGQGISSATYNSSIVNSSETQGFGIGKGVLKFNGTSPSSGEFNAFFAKGSVAFQSSNTEGISLAWLNAGEYWASEFGDQTGSTFTIDDVSENMFGITIKASFSCKLYSSDGTKFITVQNGEYVGQFNND